MNAYLHSQIIETGILFMQHKRLTGPYCPDGRQIPPYTYGILHGKDGLDPSDCWVVNWIKRNEGVLFTLELRSIYEIRISA